MGKSPNVSPQHTKQMSGSIVSPHLFFQSPFPVRLCCPFTQLKPQEFPCLRLAHLFPIWNALSFRFRLYQPHTCFHPNSSPTCRDCSIVCPFLDSYTTRQLYHCLLFIICVCFHLNTTVDIPKSQESYFTYPSGSQHRAVHRFLQESTNLLPLTGSIPELIYYLINETSSISVTIFKYNNWSEET